MRLVGLGAAALALFATSAPLAAEGDRPGLNPREVLLEVEAVGTSHAKADVALVRVPVFSRAETAAKARAANATLIERISAAARSAGVAPDDIGTADFPGSRLGFVGNEAVAAALQGAESPQPHVAQEMLEIRLRDPAIFDRLRTALEGAGAVNVLDPGYRLSDELPLYRAAKAEALAQAQAEADSYARSLGMSVGRILRVSEHADSNPWNLEAMQEMYRTMTGSDLASAENIEIRVTLSVDFALIPKR